MYIQDKIFRLNITYNGLLFTEQIITQKKANAQ